MPGGPWTVGIKKMEALVFDGVVWPLFILLWLAQSLITLWIRNQVQCGRLYS